MVTRVGISDSELRATLQYLQEQITALESMNTPADPGANKLLAWQESLNQLGWVNIGANLQLDEAAGVLTLNASGTGGGGSSAWGDLTGMPASIDAIDGLTPAADKIAYYTGASTAALATLTSTARDLLDDTDLATMRATLDVQQLDATLTALAGVTTSANKVIYATGSDAFTTTDFTAYGRSIVGVADEAAFKALVNLEAGTDFQAFSAELLQIAGLAAPGADRILFWDHSELAYKYLQVGTNLTITGTTLNASSGTATLGDGDYGDWTISGSGTVATIDAGVVTLAKMADIATSRFIGRTTAGTGVPEAITPTQATAMLDVFGPDSGSGGVKGLAPATVAGDADKFLKGDGTWASIPGGGDALTSGTLAQFAATTSAQLAGVISNETGSGLLVFNDSPLFAGTPTFPNTGLHILDTNSSHDLIIAPGSNLTADHTLTLTTGDQDVTLDISAGSVTISAAAITLLDDTSVGAMLTTLGAQASDADLSALAALSTTGMMARTAAATYAMRTLTGVANETSITNGDGVSGNPTIGLATTAKTRHVPFVINGNGSTITTGVKGDLYTSVACTITGIVLAADQSGSIVLDLWMDSYANYPPTVADTITASAKPTISSTTKAKDTTLTGWTTAWAADRFIRINVDSVSTLTRVCGHLIVTVP